MTNITNTTGKQQPTRAAAGMERRITPRFECNRGVQCWRDDSHVAFWGEFVDLGMTGCGIKSTTPLPAGSRIKMVFTLFGNSIRIAGDVRTSRDGVMGILFTSLPPGEQQKLRQVVLQLAGGGNTGSEVVANAHEALARLQRWFKQHDLLSRDMFQRLLDGECEPSVDSSTMNRLYAKLAECRFRM